MTEAGNNFKTDGSPQRTLDKTIPEL